MRERAPSLYQQLISPQGIAAGWRRVERKNSAPGVDGITVEAFRQRLHERMETLRRELTRGTYRTRPLRRLRLAKPDGTDRLLGIPTVRDRIVQSALHQLLTPTVEGVLKDCSYGYRPGRSHHQAIEQVSREGKRGFNWVVDGDIESFFDRVNHGLMLRRFRALVPDEDVAALVAQWITAPVGERGTRSPQNQGLPQGAVISPLLANLYLDAFDVALLGRGFRIVRFADDFVVLCPSRQRAGAALIAVRHALKALHLRLNAQKTSVVSFEEGFRFLGSEFRGGRVHSSRPTRKKKSSLPRPKSLAPAQMTPTQIKSTREASSRPCSSAPARSDSGRSTHESGSSASARPSPPPSPPSSAAASPSRSDMPPFLRTLYVQEQGASLRVSGGRFRLTAPGDPQSVLLSIPVTKIDQIVVFGVCHLSPAAVRHCLRRHIPVTLLSSRGRYFGRIESTEARSIELQRLQFAKSSDPDFNLPLAGRVVQGKIANMKTLLLRRQKQGAEPSLKRAVRQLNRAGRRLQTAATLDEVRGFEGAAAAAYFGVFGDMIRVPGIHFERRMKRPPPDPVNALLSFGYTLLFYNLYSMIRLHRLNPYVGVLHAERSGHPALVSDLVEEFRPLIDSMVLGLINRKTLGPGDFSCPHPAGGTEGGGDVPAAGCFLTDEARKTFIRRFEQLMSREVTDPASGRVLSYRRVLDLQVRRYAQHLRGDESYEPFHWR